jgi:hypothetical protein
VVQSKPWRKNRLDAFSRGQRHGRHHVTLHAIRLERIVVKSDDADVVGAPMVPVQAFLPGSPCV